MSNFKVGQIVVLTLWAQDVPAAAHFYRDVLGLRPLDIPGHDDGTHFQVGGAHLVILKGRPQPAENAEPEHFPLFALAVDDLDKAVEQLGAHKVPLPRGVESHGRNRWVMLHDPAGNLIELVQHG